MNISTDRKKIDKVHYPFTTKVTNNLGIKGTYFKIISTYNKLTGNMYYPRKNWKHVFQNHDWDRSTYSSHS